MYAWYFNGIVSDCRTISIFLFASILFCQMISNLKHPSNQSNSNTFKQCHCQCIEDNRQQNAKNKKNKKKCSLLFCLWWYHGTLKQYSFFDIFVHLCLSQTATQFIMLKVNFCCHCRSYLNKYASHIHTRTLHYIWMVGKFAFHLFLEQ